MKFFIFFFFLLNSLPVLAISRQEVETLLRSKNISLRGLEAQGSVLLMGEVTGHGKVIPMDKVEAILTDREVILRHEIESISPHGQRSLSTTDSIRGNGRYILTEDVQATILSR